VDLVLYFLDTIDFDYGTKLCALEYLDVLVMPESDLDDMDRFPDRDLAIIRYVLAKNADGIKDALEVVPEDHVSHLLSWIAERYPADLDQVIAQSDKHCFEEFIRAWTVDELMSDESVDNFIQVFSRFIQHHDLSVIDPAKRCQIIYLVTTTGRVDFVFATPQLYSGTSQEKHTVVKGLVESHDSDYYRLNSPRLELDGIFELASIMRQISDETPLDLLYDWNMARDTPVNMENAHIYDRCAIDATKFVTARSSMSVASVTQCLLDAAVDKERVAFIRRAITDGYSSAKTDQFDILRNAISQKPDTFALLAELGFPLDELFVDILVKLAVTKINSSETTPIARTISRISLAAMLKVWKPSQAAIDTVFKTLLRPHANFIIVDDINVFLDSGNAPSEEHSEAVRLALDRAHRRL
jgi:hypothetical protein